MPPARDCGAGAPAPSSRTAARHACPARGRAVRVLVVEDDRDAEVGALLSAAIHANVVHNTIIHGARRDSSGTSGEGLGLAITHEVCNVLRLTARVRA